MLFGLWVCSSNKPNLNFIIDEKICKAQAFQSYCSVKIMLLNRQCSSALSARLWVYGISNAPSDLHWGAYRTEH